MKRSLLHSFIIALLLCSFAFSQDGEIMRAPHTDDPERLPDTQIPLLDEFPARPAPPIELGDKLLGQGPLKKGWRMPGGAVWTPSLWVFGNYRTAYQTFHNGTTKSTEWANRLDLFTNLRLTGTERILFSLRPGDEFGRFSGYRFRPTSNDGWVDGGNLDVRTLFFEGDLSEVFPFAAKGDRQPKQIAFSIGRQPFFVQEGIMFNDDIDAVAIARNNIPLKGTSNFRTTVMFAWDEVNRFNNSRLREDNSAKVIGWFNQADLYRQTVDFDIAYVDADDVVTYDDEGNEVSRGTGSGFFIGISNYQPIGRFNTAIRANASLAQGGEESDIMSNGLLIFGEVSFSPYGREDIIYVNGFLGVEKYRSASRGPGTGGPMGRNGLLFAAVGMGSWGAPLGNTADDSAGVSVGYQYFINTRRQLVFEAGARNSTLDSETTDRALGIRFQQAMGRKFLLRADTFYTERDKVDSRYGTRMELQYKF